VKASNIHDWKIFAFMKRYCMQYLTLVNSQLNGVLNFNGQTSPYINVIAGLTELLHYRLAETGS